jgi:uncharacterized repeat protein (TIGR03837 family)
MRTMIWDIFCRVVDNLGDVGVCWRIATDLAARGQQVRLRIDDASALTWMAPNGAAGVEVVGWPGSHDSRAPGEVVLETFGCELPEAFVAQMAATTPAPAWINLEYLSAESYVERSHRLRSPQVGVALNLRKTFFYPGFTARTGGLLREPDLHARRARFDCPAWLETVRGRAGIGFRPGERVVSLFCYLQPALHSLVDALASQPTLLLAAAGEASQQVSAWLGPTLQRGALRAAILPRLTQTDYDHLLWASDLNFVRGEDSFVRAQWAAKPFVWQIYRQPDGAHRRKLDAFLDRFQPSRSVREVWNGWNGFAPMPDALPDIDAWHLACTRWRSSLLDQADLTTQLIEFAAETR